MKTICFYFQVHQPFRLRRYRFFDIAKNHNYFDDYANRSIMQKVAQKCYLPTNQMMLDLINEYGTRFKIAYSISGTALDQFEMYAPEVLESFQKLAKTGCVEFLSETYSHSLCSLKSAEEFTLQVQTHMQRVEQLFGLSPKTFRNTELIYSDQIGALAANLGFGTILTEGAEHILGWKSPNYVYANAINPKLRVLLKNYRLSDDIAFRFSNRQWSEWPLTTEKYVEWLNSINPNEEIVNLFMDYETFGEHQWPETGIFDFMRALPKRIFSNSNYEFLTPSEAAAKHQPVALLHVPQPISWADEERDLTAWLGNALQDEAFNKLYSIAPIVEQIDDNEIQRDWRYLQTSDHFYYMCTKWFSDGDVHKYFNPYETPYEAFINYMNALSDFILRLNQKQETLSQQNITQTIAHYEARLAELQKLVNQKVEPAKTPANKKTSGKTSTKAKTVTRSKSSTSAKPTKTTTKATTKPAAKASAKSTSTSTTKSTKSTTTKSTKSTKDKSK